MNDLWIETGSISMNKHGETLCAAEGLDLG